MEYTKEIGVFTVRDEGLNIGPYSSLRFGLFRWGQIILIPDVADARGFHDDLDRSGVPIAEASASNSAPPIQNSFQFLLYLNSPVYNSPSVFDIAQSD